MTVHRSPDRRQNQQIDVNHMSRILIGILISFLLFSASAFAEIEKTAVPCEQKICFYWWPKLATVKGWHHDRQHSYSYRINAQAPDGYTFANAESVIYARALYKPRVPETASLEDLIGKDKKEFLSRDPHIAYAEAGRLKTGDGQSLKSFTFFPKKGGNWEQVSYGEEDDFYLIFTVSSRTKEGFTKAVEDYKTFIKRYKRKP